jgi:hypothetical protein
VEVDKPAVDLWIAHGDWNGETEDEDDWKDDEVDEACEPLFTVGMTGSLE